MPTTYQVEVDGPGASASADCGAEVLFHEFYSDMQNGMSMTQAQNQLREWIIERGRYHEKIKSMQRNAGFLTAGEIANTVQTYEALKTLATLAAELAAAGLVIGATFFTGGGALVAGPGIVNWGSLLAVAGEDSLLQGGISFAGTDKGSPIVAGSVTALGTFVSDVIFLGVRGLAKAGEIGEEAKAIGTLLSAVPRGAVGAATAYTSGKNANFILRGSATKSVVGVGADVVVEGMLEMSPDLAIPIEASLDVSMDFAIDKLAEPEDSWSDLDPNVRPRGPFLDMVAPGVEFVDQCIQPYSGATCN
jgi:hypothetical protein